MLPTGLRCDAANRRDSRNVGKISRHTAIAVHDARGIIDRMPGVLRGDGGTRVEEVATDHTSPSVFRRSDNQAFWGRSRLQEKECNSQDQRTIVWRILYGI